MPEHILAFDMGATKIAGAVFNLGGQRLTEIHSLPTMAAQSPNFTLMNLKRVGVEASRKAGLDGSPLAVGMGCAGPIDVVNGRLLEVESVPRLSGFNMRGFIEEEFGAPLYLENDAACFILGEARQGAARRRSSAIGLTLGARCGCGVLLNSELYTGATNNAGAIGRAPLAGSDFDRTLSGPGLQRIYEEVAEAEAPSARELAAQARGGDELAVETWRRFGEALGQGLGLLCGLLDPQVAVLGGPLAQHMLLFREAMYGSLEAVVGERMPQVEVSALGSAAAGVGAAEYARERLQANS